MISLGNKVVKPTSHPLQDALTRCRVWGGGGSSAGSEVRYRVDGGSGTGSGGQVQGRGVRCRVRGSGTGFGGSGAGLGEGIKENKVQGSMYPKGLERGTQTAYTCS